MKTTWISSFFAFMLALPLAYAADDMQAFPAAEQGMTRHVLQLPAQSDESAYKVELIAGKEVLIESRNHYFFGGKIEEKNIEGWGYTRYVVSPHGPMMGTMMAVDPNAPKVKRFIPISGGPYLMRYNSRLPLVVYAPKDVEVRYRIWRAGDEWTKIEQG